MYYDKKLGVKIPKRNNIYYSSIATYDDYEYTNCIVFEMAQRTDKFNELIQLPRDERTGEKWVNDVKSLGLQPYDMKNRFHRDTIPFPYSLNDKKPPIVSQSLTSFCIHDIEEGLVKLICFYLKEKKIYFLHEDDIKSKKKYRWVKDIDYINIRMHLENYYIPGKIEYKNSKRNFLVSLNGNIPLKNLEEKFLNTLSPSTLKTKIIQFLHDYSKPIFSFDECSIINLPVNLNLPKENLVAYIEKIKDDYDDNYLNVKHPFEILGEQLDHVSEPSSSKAALPKKWEKRKIALADAFYVYDLYAILEPLYRLKREEIKNSRNNEIELFKQSKGYDKKINIENYKDISRYDEFEWTQDSLKDKIISISKLSKNYVEKYRSLMNYYINKGNYKELITGVYTKS